MALTPCRKWPAVELGGMDLGGGQVPSQQQKQEDVCHLTGELGKGADL